MPNSIKHILVLFTLLLGTTIAAQENDYTLERPYKGALGIKLGNLFQLDYKHFITPDISINLSSGIYVIDWDGIFSSLTLTYHHDTHIENMYWYYGGGLATRHALFLTQYGMAGAVGLEVVTTEKDANFFIDLQPTAYLKRELSFGSFGGLLSRSVDLDFTVGATVGLRYVLFD